MVQVWGVSWHHMIGLLFIAVSFYTGLGVWFGGIRPYLSRHGGVVITGISWGISAWADWQQCREFARTRNDAKAMALTRYFIAAQVGFLAGIILMVCGM